jgi:hypothetical protein
MMHCPCLAGTAAGPSSFDMKAPQEAACGAFLCFCGKCMKFSGGPFYPAEFVI